MDSTKPISPALALFLAGIGMRVRCINKNLLKSGFLESSLFQDYIPNFAREEITMDSLMLLSDGDLKEMGLPTGPRKTVLKAIAERKRDLERDEAIEDTNL